MSANSAQPAASRTLEGSDAPRTPLDATTELTTDLGDASAGPLRGEFDRQSRRAFPLAALGAFLAWRPLAVLAYAGSAASFLAGLVFLYDAEGPGRPDVQYQLSTSTGQALFVHATTALAIAAVLAAVGAVLLHSRLWSRATISSALAIVLTTLAGAFMLAILSLQYGLTAVGQEGIAPSTTAFHALAVFEHGAADLFGLAGFGLLAAATAITSATLLKRQMWRGAAITGLIAALTLPILDVLQIGYTFMLPLAAWELLIAAYAAFSPKDRLVTAGTELCEHRAVDRCPLA
jgi:hypothetical protein